MSASRQSRLAAFDGLRAVAALSVVAYHVGLACALSRSGALAPVVSELKAGVSVFFVISGCLLYLPYARALRAGDALPGWRSYAQRRALRILPGYWVALTVLALTPLGAPIVTTDWWRYYGLAQIYSPDTMFSGLGVAWSLCVEVTFYAALPFFARGIARLLDSRPAARRGHAQLAVLAAIIVASAAVRLWFTGGSLDAPVQQSHFILATSLLGFLDWFALGMALAVLAVWWESGERLLPAVWRLAARPGACWALALALFAASAATQHGDLFLPLFGLAAHVAAGLGAALIVLPAVAPSARDQVPEPSPLLRGLTHPRALWLGAISYGIYLWHIIVIEAMRGWAPIVPDHSPGLGVAAGTLVVVVAAAIALGAASWYLVERPAKRIFKPAGEPQPAAAGT